MHWISHAELSPDGRTVTATAPITTDHPFLDGDRLLPSALIELLAQAAAAGAALRAQTENRPAPTPGLLAALRDLCILTDVPVPSTLTLTATVERTFGELSLCHVAAHLDGVPVAHAHMTFHISATLAPPAPIE
jgi:predicted hotdog family 3-hydroxylacyl-ACP dehydratase